MYVDKEKRIKFVRIALSDRCQVGANAARKILQQNGQVRLQDNSFFLVFVRGGTEGKERNWAAKRRDARNSYDEGPGNEVTIEGGPGFEASTTKRCRASDVS